MSFLGPAWGAGCSSSSRGTVGRVRTAGLAVGSAAGGLERTRELEFASGGRAPTGFAAVIELLPRGGRLVRRGEACCCWALGCACCCCCGRCCCCCCCA